MLQGILTVNFLSADFLKRGKFDEKNYLLSVFSLLSNNRELLQATFLRHGRKPEVSISPARKVVSPRFSN